MLNNRRDLVGKKIETLDILVKTRYELEHFYKYIKELYDISFSEYSFPSSSSFTSKKIILKCSTNNTSYVLKEKPKYSVGHNFLKLSSLFQNQINKELNLAPEIIKTLDGDYFAFLGHRVFFLTKFVAGKDFNGSINQARNAMVALARIHKLGRNLDCEASEPERLYKNNVCLEKSLLGRKFQNTDLAKKVIGWLRELNETNKLLNPLCLGIIHGDPAPFNMVFSERDEVSAINDFDNCCYGEMIQMDYTLVYPTVKFDEVFQNFFDTPLSTVSEKWLGAIYNNPKAKGYEIIRHTFPEMSIPEAQEKALEFGLEWAKVHNLYPGCMEFLRNLKANPEYKLGLLTNGPSDFQRAIVDFFEISECFDVIVASGDEDVGIRKPDSGVFDIMAQKMELPTESLFMIGDVMDKDILPAIKLGWGGIWVKPNVEKIGDSHINFQDLLQDAYSISTEPLSITWSDISLNNELLGNIDTKSEL
jgi:HAD superfamily hydrolase (TIGR01549 family)